MTVSESIKNTTQKYLNDFQNSETLSKLLDSKETVTGFFDSAINLGNTLVGLAGQSGIAGFVFDIAQDESVELTSVITDHYVETGSPVQDHIALRPEKITVRGLVGEYKDVQSGEKSFIEQAAEKLSVLNSYLPTISQAAQSVYNNLDTIKSAGNNLKEAFSSAGGLGMDLFEAYKNINMPQNEQQKAFLFFESLRSAGAVFTVQTPYRYYTDMAVESIRATQSGATVDQSTFEVTLKKIRYVTTNIVNLEKKESEKIEEGETEGRLEEQVEPPEEEGFLSTAWSSTKETVGGWFSSDDVYVDIPLDIPYPERGRLVDEAIESGKVAW